MVDFAALDHSAQAAAWAEEGHKEMKDQVGIEPTGRFTGAFRIVPVTMAACLQLGPLKSMSSFAGRTAFAKPRAVLVQPRRHSFPL